MEYSSKIKNSILIALCLLAATLWFIMFSPWTNRLFNFWLLMSISAITLTSLSLIIDYKKDRYNLKAKYKFHLKYVMIGILSAFVLYMIFFIGDIFSSYIFSFAKSQVNSVYNTKTQGSELLIGLLLLFLIGPAEEIFWRGFIQSHLSSKTSDIKGYILTSLIYALVHIFSFNFMLIMAAFICGLFWGLIYLRYKNIIPCIISHALWDLFIFIILPIK